MKLFKELENNEICPIMENMEKFEVFYLHGLGSSCQSTKAIMTQSLVKALGGIFKCKEIPYLKKGFLPFEVVNLLEDFLRERETEKVFLIGSSMGAYSWLDFLVSNENILDTSYIQKVILITPPISLFDDLEKWAPTLEGDKVKLSYGDTYIFDFKEFLEILKWDIINSPRRTLLLTHQKIYSIIALRDEVVNNSVIFKLGKLGFLSPNHLYKLDDGHQLKNQLAQLEAILRNLLRTY